MSISSTLSLIFWAVVSSAIIFGEDSSIFVICQNKRSQNCFWSNFSFEKNSLSKTFDWWMSGKICLDCFAFFTIEKHNKTSKLFIEFILTHTIEISLYLSSKFEWHFFWTKFGFEESQFNKRIKEQSKREVRRWQTSVKQHLLLLV
jgi:hypothetical protein